MEIVFALKGQLAEHIRKEKRIVQAGVTRGARRASVRLKNEMRRQIRKKGFVQQQGSLELAWQNRVWPDRALSANAAAMVYSKSQRVHGAFMADRLIRAHRATWLVVPLDPARARGWDYSREHSDSNQPRKYAHVAAAKRHVPLRFVPLDATRALLVARQGGQDVAYFLLLKQVRLRRRLDFDGPAQKWADKMPSYIVTEMEREERRLGP